MSRNRLQTILEFLHNDNRGGSRIFSINAKENAIIAKYKEGRPQSACEYKYNIELTVFYICFIY